MKNDLEPEILKALDILVSKDIVLIQSFINKLPKSRRRLGKKYVLRTLNEKLTPELPNYDD